jgi:hypothetical protein
VRVVLLRDVRFYLGLCLFALCLYGAIAGSLRSYDIRKMVAEPSRYAGVKLNWAYVKVVQVLSQQFQIKNRGVTIAVQIPTHLEHRWKSWREQLKVGHAVSLRAVFHPDRYLLLHEMHIHHGRRLKVWASILALFSLATMLMYEHRKASLNHA